MTSFLENKELTAITIILLLSSILCRFVVGIFLNSLIREAENMSTTQNRLLKQCKVKFRNCYKLNDGVPNIPVFVDKFLSRLQIGRFSLDGISHLAGQLMLLSIVTAGLGACKGIIDGSPLSQIVPFYLMSFLGLYLYFSISGLVDLDGKRELLKVSLTDYLENHMAARLSVLDESEAAAEGRKFPTPDLTDPETVPSNASGKWRAATGLTDSNARRRRRIQQTLLDAEDKPRREAAEKSGETVASDRTGGGSSVEVQTAEQVFTKKQEQELEELLKEFFA